LYHYQHPYFCRSALLSIFFTIIYFLFYPCSELRLEGEKWTEMNNDTLDEHVKELLADNHRIGANNMKVRLENVGIRVPRERVREAMQRVDPTGVALRSRRAIKRRSYHVHGPNSLWHLDGNHKLIRYVMFCVVTP
jgi:hypothetical protein